MHVTEKLRKLRERAGLSMDQLAKEMGYSGQSSIQRYEDKNLHPQDYFKIDFVKRLLLALEGKGDPPISMAEIVALSSSMPVDMAPFFRRAPSASKPEPAALDATQKIPVYGQAIGGPDGRFVLNGNKVADILAPPALYGVRDAYAVYMVGDSMEPRYYAGEAIYVNPKLPVRSGNFVVVQIEGEDDVPSAYVKKFISRNSKELVLEQLNPPDGEDAVMRFPSSSVVSIHKIVFAGEG